MPDKGFVRSLHLTSDKKLLSWIKHTFSREGWIAEFIIINRHLTNKEQVIDENTTEVSGDLYGINIVLEKASPVDIIFYYFMDNAKAEILLKMPDAKINCWCFYGAEIYQQTPLFRNKIYGPQTRKKFWILPEIRFRFELRSIYYKLIRRERTPYESLRKAIPSVDYMLWYIEKEISFIRETLVLPPFLFFQFFQLDDALPLRETLVYRTHKKILIGNSATIENNHFDILFGLSSTNLEGYTLTLPLTYGQFPRYKNMVKLAFSKRFGANVTFLDQHMSLDRYYEELKLHQTAIFLHRRQQGLGNIFYLLYVGAKVYLSRESIIYTWLLENGIQIFSFEDEFKRDFQDKDITMTDEQGMHNRNVLRNLLDNARNENAFNTWEKSIAELKSRE